MRSAMTPTGAIGFEGQDLSAEDRGGLLADLYFEGERRIPYLWRFAALTTFSAAIAAMGLISDSAAVVIGAMLIAPLMTPIMALSAAVVQAWPRRQLESLVIILGGAALSVAVGWCVAALTPLVGPEAALSGEVLARTQPALIDLGIAIVAGAAGAYITVRREASSALPGVGIAVALVPPLAAVGIAWNAGRSHEAVGAALLFATNLAAITLAGGLTFVFAGFLTSPSRVRERRLATLITVGLVLAISIPLAANSVRVVRRSDYARTGADAVMEWNPDLEVTRVDVDTRESPVRFDIDVAGAGSDDHEIDDLARALAAEIGSPVIVELQVVPKFVGLSAP